MDIAMITSPISLSRWHASRTFIPVLDERIYIFPDRGSQVYGRRLMSSPEKGKQERTRALEWKLNKWSPVYVLLQVIPSLRFSGITFGLTLHRIVSDLPDRSSYNRWGSVLIPYNTSRSPSLTDERGSSLREFIFCEISHSSEMALYWQPR